MLNPDVIPNPLILTNKYINCAILWISFPLCVVIMLYSWSNRDIQGSNLPYPNYKIINRDIQTSYTNKLPDLHVPYLRYPNLFSCNWMMLCHMQGRCVTSSTRKKIGSKQCCLWAGTEPELWVRGGGFTIDYV